MTANEHHLGIVAYLATWVGLLILTGLTFGLSYVSLGEWGMPVAILIATTKSLLVVLLFMHLLEQGTTARIIVFAAAALLTLLCALTILDASVRSEDEPDAQRKSGASQSPRRPLNSPAR